MAMAQEDDTAVFAPSTPLDHDSFRRVSLPVLLKISRFSQPSKSTGNDTRNLPCYVIVLSNLPFSQPLHGNESVSHPVSCSLSPAVKTINQPARPRPSRVQLSRRSRPLGRPGNVTGCRHGLAQRPVSKGQSSMRSALGK